MPEENNEPPSSTPGPSVRLRLRVEGMTCPSCERHVEQALLTARATQATADFRRGEAVLSLPRAGDEVAIKAVVEATGYQPCVIEQIAPSAEGDADQREYRLQIAACRSRE